MRRQGDLDGTLQHFQAYREITERLAVRDPRNMEWKLEESFGHSNVAAVLEAKGDLRGSLAELETTLALKKEVAASNPEKVEWQRTLATSHNRIGVVLHKLGELPRARDHYRRDLEIEEALLRAQPANAPLQAATAIAHSWVAAVLEDLDERDEALRHRVACLDITTRLVERDPSNGEWQRELATSRLRVADNHWLRGQAALATSLYRQSLVTLTGLLARSPSSAFLRRDVGSVHFRLARLMLAGGRPAEAIAEARAGLDALSPAAVAANRDAARFAAECEVLISAGLLAAGRVAEAAAQSARALDAIEPLARGAQDPAINWKVEGKHTPPKTVVQFKRINGIQFKPDSKWPGGLPVVDGSDRTTCAATDNNDGTTTKGDFKYSVNIVVVDGQGRRDAVLPRSGGGESGFEPGGRESVGAVSARESGARIRRLRRPRCPVFARRGSSRAALGRTACSVPRLIAPTWSDTRPESPPHR